MATDEKTSAEARTRNSTQESVNTWEWTDREVDGKQAIVDERSRIDQYAKSITARYRVPTTDKNVRWGG